MADKKENTTVSGNVMFYQNPQPLTKDKHQKFGVSPDSKAL